MFVDLHRRRKEGDDWMMKTRCGSHDYAAPEMYRNSEPYDAQAVDVFALGVVLFALLSGTFPFEDVNAQMRNDYVIPYMVPQEAHPIIKGALSIDPKERPSAKEIRDNSWVQASK